MPPHPLHTFTLEEHYVKDDDEHMAQWKKTPQRYG